MTAHRELPILDDNGELFLFAPIVVLGVMYFPGDLDKVDAFATALGADALRQQITDDIQTRRDVETSGLFGKQSFWRLLKRDKEVEALMADAENSVDQGRLAANVLTTLLSLSVHVVRLASVNNAVRGVMNAESKSRSTVYDAWGRYKSVAHLWAAYFVYDGLQMDAKEKLIGEAMPKELPAGITTEHAKLIDDEVVHRNEFADEFGFWKDENFLAFLSLAEGFRLKAERQGLEFASEAFGVPAALDIPPATIELSEPDNSILSGIFTS